MSIFFTPFIQSIILHQIVPFPFFFYSANALQMYDIILITDYRNNSDIGRQAFVLTMEAP